MSRTRRANEGLSVTTERRLRIVDWPLDELGLGGPQSHGAIDRALLQAGSPGGTTGSVQHSVVPDHPWLSQQFYGHYAGEPAQFRTKQLTSLDIPKRWASRLVCAAIVLISPTTSPIFLAPSARARTTPSVRRASSNALPAIFEDCAT